MATVFLLSGAFAFAESVHLPQAVEHTKAAITHGEAGHASVLVEHASTALTHAEASEKAEANPHTEEGITHLKDAIDVGKKVMLQAAPLTPKKLSNISNWQVNQRNKLRSGQFLV